MSIPKQFRLVLLTILFIYSISTCPIESKANVDLLMETRFNSLNHDQLLSLLSNSEHATTLFKEDIIELQELGVGIETRTIDTSTISKPSVALKKRFIQHFGTLLCKGLFGTTTTEKESSL